MRGFWARRQIGGKRLQNASVPPISTRKAACPKKGRFIAAPFSLAGASPHVICAGMAMLQLTLEELAERLPAKARLMGLDLGTKTIGLGLSDVERRLASPLDTIRRVKFSADADALLKRAADFEIAAFVIGLPLNMDGTEGPRVQATRAFMRNLSARGDRPFVYWDERLSTAAVTRELIAQDASRAKRAEVVDRMAAAYILQGALDRLARLADAKRQ
jgi:putative holliday junction resolvase